MIVKLSDDHLRPFLIEFGSDSEHFLAASSSKFLEGESFTEGNTLPSLSLVTKFTATLYRNPYLKILFLNLLFSTTIDFLSGSYLKFNLICDEQQCLEVHILYLNISIRINWKFSNVLNTTPKDSCFYKIQ
uniref:Uncharacterized protein n=1 Tax=Glossina austeni TaxID=7395 RepID=A0A1A9VVN5_GLOAU